MTDNDFTPEEETKFRQMAAMPDLQDKVVTRRNACAQTHAHATYHHACVS